MVVNTVVILAATALVSRVLYDRRLQTSEAYKASSVPFSSIMDIGFLAVIPLIVVAMRPDAAWLVLGVVVAGGGVMTAFMAFVAVFSIPTGSPPRRNPCPT